MVLADKRGFEYGVGLNEWWLFINLIVLILLLEVY